MTTWHTPLPVTRVSAVKGPVCPSQGLDSGPNWTQVLPYQKAIINWERVKVVTLSFFSQWYCTVRTLCVCTHFACCIFYIFLHSTLLPSPLYALWHIPKVTVTGMLEGQTRVKPAIPLTLAYSVGFSLMILLLLYLKIMATKINNAFKLN